EISMAKLPRHQRPLTPGERWTYIIAVVVLFGALTAEVATNFQPVKLSCLFVVLFWIPLLVVHECAHAVATNWVGWELRLIVLGMGRRIGLFQVGSAMVEIRMVPFEGFVLYSPTDFRHYRWKSAFIAFAATGAELLLALLVLLWAGPDTLFSRSEDYSVIALQSLALAAAAGGVINLIPHAVWTPQGTIANDGLAIIRSLFSSWYDFRWRKEYRYEEPQVEEEEVEEDEPWR